MRCIMCGAQLRDTDRFCPGCGTRVSQQQFLEETELAGTAESLEGYEEHGPDRVKKSGKKRKKKHVATETDILYDEHLFRDSFLDEKRENRSHALLMTLMVLMVIALCVGIFLAVYYQIWKRPIPTDEDAIVIVEETGTRQPETYLTAAPDPQRNEALQQEETESSALAETQSQVQASTEEPVTEAPSKEESIRKKIEQIMVYDSDAQAYSVYVYDLKKQTEYAVGNAEEPMYASGTIAVPILYTAATLLDQGRITLNDQILYVNSIGGRGEDNPQNKDGSYFALSYYLTTMLTYNDNNCMNCLIDYMGLDTINEVCAGQGMTGTRLERYLVTEVTDGKENYVSAKDLTTMVKELYNGKFSVIGREFMQKYFRISEYDANRTLVGLAEGPSGASLFLNQNGKGDTRFAETAVIGDDRCSYVVSIMCMGDYGFYFEDAVKEVSSYIWGAMHE